MKMTVALNDRAEAYLAAAFYLVEADSFAQHTLWAQHSRSSIFPPWDRRKNAPAFQQFDWEELQGGGMETIGFLAGKPVVIQLSFSRIAGRIVCFWYLSSEVTDYRKAERWLRKRFTGQTPDGRRAECDADNFGHCLIAIGQANAAGATTSDAGR